MAEADLQNIEEEQEKPAETPLRQRKPRRWYNYVLRVFLAMVLFVLLIPVMLYIPPIQDFAVGVATRQVKAKTGMDIGIGRLRLTFPIRVHLQDVYIVEATGDTMVQAREAIADVKLMPLLKLEVKLNTLRLDDGYYRMVSADSSMVMAIRAGMLEVDDKSEMNIATSQLSINRAKLRDGHVSLYMDVWKKKETPDTAASESAPFVIKANDLDLQNFTFGMSMLPTIDTLNLKMRHINLSDAQIDLGKNIVEWGRASMAGGDITYLTPTAEYIKTHPAPPSTPSTGPPMQIRGHEIEADSLRVLYAVKEAKPLPGFDASYIQLENVSLGLREFYNESSTVRLPITRLTGRERSGLHITHGEGTVAIDSIGLQLQGLSIRTPYTSIEADADVPFALMALEPNADMMVAAEGHLGLADINAFMPAVREMTAMVPAGKPLNFDIRADGSLSELTAERLKVEMPGVVRIGASGIVRNPLDINKMQARIKFDGEINDPRVASNIIAINDITIPSLTIDGNATVDGNAYGADFRLATPQGDLAAIGKVALTPETYSADLTAVDFNVAQFMPSMGIGVVSANIVANGRGFNPISGKAVTDAQIRVDRIDYNQTTLRDIRIDALIDQDGVITLDVNSANPGLDLMVRGSGEIHPELYSFDLDADIRDLDLMRLGMIDSVCYASGRIALKGSMSPDMEVCDIDLQSNSLTGCYGSQYVNLPEGIDMRFIGDPVSTQLALRSQQTDIDFHAAAGLKGLMASMDKVMAEVNRQMEAKSLEMTKISRELPTFDLRLNASGRGLLSQFLEPQGFMLDTIYAEISNVDSLINGRVGVYNIKSSTANIDTVSFNIDQRGDMVDYLLHVGNRRGTLDEFAKVNISGYAGSNRMSVFLKQWNIKGEQGYRIGLTAAMQDSIVTAHVTPLKSTIAYLPWSFNKDNYVDFNLKNMQMEAKLEAKSAESSIKIMTEKDQEERNNLLVKIDNLHIEDFLQMSAMAPPVKGTLDSDLRVLYHDNRFVGGGDVSLHNLYYEKTRVGDFDLNLNAGYGFDMKTDVRAGLKINGREAASTYISLKPGENQELRADTVGISLTRFPLDIANGFLDNMLVLDGNINGDMSLSGSLSKPIINGVMSFDSVTARIPQFDATLKVTDDELSVVDNIVSLKDFDIYGANDNPLQLNGMVDIQSFDKMMIDLKATATEFQLIKSNNRSRGDIFGKIFLTLNAGVKGPMQRLDVNADLRVLDKTDATYRLNMAPADLQIQNQDDVVRFVNYNDSAAMAAKDSVVESPLNMKIKAQVQIASGTHIAVLLSSNGTDKVEINPTATLNYNQNYMGDMTMTGTLKLGEGYARYSIPVVGEKNFSFDPNSTITWMGDVLNPTLDITATDKVKANVNDGSNARLVNFDVILHATNTLENLNVAFDLSTKEDLSIQNELQSMSADQRQTQAMNMLLYGQYTGQNTKTNTSGENILYSFLESQLNSWAAKAIKGVDLSFGVNQYDKTTDGVTNTETSYSYQVSKTLFNNRFKIQVGGNYSTDTDDSDIAQNLVSDVSLEYVIKQSQSTNMSAKLFRHSDFENILEGDITEMGAGIVVKRRVETLSKFFNFLRKRKKKKSTTPAAEEKSDSTALPVKVDSINSGASTPDTK
ncbi:MAG: translocation/assembly module TamB domain-containing protein [Bacteroidales bacterium]|nr:translocation/assembly module TamB domain-containing protein [Bacteroidales bacterium]